MRSGLQVSVTLCHIAPVLRPSRLPPRVDAAALSAWVLRPELSAPDGRILSWVEPGGSGFAYDEASAFYHRLFGWMGESARAQGLARVLNDRVERFGWLRRGDTAYLFDTAMALGALSDQAPVVQRLLVWIAEERACHPVKRPG